MDDILKVNLKSIYYNTPENVNNIRQTVLSILTSIHESALWNKHIKGIVVTDCMEEEVKAKASDWKLPLDVSKEKEFRVASKILFNYNPNNPEHYIYFSADIFFSENLSIQEIIVTPFLNIFSEQILPEKIRNQKFNYYHNTVNGFIVFASTEWVKAEYIKSISKKIFTSPLIMNQNKFLIAFKRGLKKSLFDYRSDKFDSQKSFDLFLSEFCHGLTTLFLRLVENETTNSELTIKDSESSRDLIAQVINEIKELTRKCLEREDYNILKLREAIIKFSAHFEIIFESTDDDKFQIQFNKEPKDYFVGELVETEPRIVCFMDILGFSELIETYDTDLTSTLLQDIQESFALTKKYLLDSFHNTTQVRQPNYQTFSDNICISIPYYDSELDFLANLNLLITYVRGFQSAMMTKGFFTRGGISTGSYYSDGNIIFSKGLVNAYRLESSKAIYPRVIIDQNIIKKMFNYNHERVKFFGLDSVILVDWENISFLNPFGFEKNFIERFLSALSKQNYESLDSSLLDLSLLIKTFNELKQGMFQTISEYDKKNMETIKKNISENIYMHFGNEKILTKYLWLWELIKWYEGDETSKLKFQYFTDRMKD